MTQHVVLLEGDATWSGDAAILIHWDRSDVPTGRLSLPQLVDHNWPELRSDYLSWIHDCGETRTETGTIKAEMHIGDSGLSAWWMTLMAEKSPMKTRTVYTVLKLRSLEILCDTEEAEEITYVGSDPRIDSVLKRWCAETGKTYRRLTSGNAPDNAPLGRRVRFLPHILRGLAWFGWIWWTRLRPVQKRDSHTSRANPDDVPDCAIVTYFPNCDTQALENGVFRSNYWQDAHDIFDRMPAGIDWIWMYAEGDSVSLNDALDHRDRCNAKGDRQHFHLLEDFVTPAVFRRAIRNWFTLGMKGGRLMAVCGERKLPGSQLNLEPVLQEDWDASLRGIVAAEAAYYQAAFEAMVLAQPAPSYGLYVFENQPWESALVHAWKHHGVDRVIAHQHEAMKPLNLRLFDDPRTLQPSGGNSKPLPDILAIGSNRARDDYLAAGWPADKAVLVESLRFRSATTSAHARSDKRYLLLVTGYLGAETQTMLGMTAEADASGALGAYDGIRIKPHPFLPVNDMAAALNFRSPVEIVTESLDALWPSTGFAFMANSTAAVFEALAARIPSAVCAPTDDLNFSPALGMDGVAMITRAETLAIAVQARATPEDAPEFCRETGLPRWSELLGLAVGENVAPSKVAG